MSRISTRSRDISVVDAQRSGMKKDYPTVLDESANAQEKIIVSGGKNGIQIELTTEII